MSEKLSVSSKFLRRRSGIRDEEEWETLKNSGHSSIRDIRDFLLLPFASIYYKTLIFWKKFHQSRQGSRLAAKHQVGAAGAVGGSEARQRYRAGRLSAEGLRPGMLQALRAGRKPDFAHLRVRAQRIDMPARTRRRAQMVQQPSAQPARAERTADVQIPARPDVKNTQPPDRHPAGLPRPQDEHIRSRQARQLFHAQPPSRSASAARHSLSSSRALSSGR